MNIIISENENVKEVVVDFDCFASRKEKGKALNTKLVRKYPRELFVRDDEQINYKNLHKNVTKKLFGMKLIKAMMRDKVIMSTFDDNIDTIIKELYNSETMIIENGGSVYISRSVGAGSVHELIVNEETNKKTGDVNLKVVDDGISKVAEMYRDNDDTDFLER